MWPFSRNRKNEECGRCHLCFKPDGIAVVYSGSPKRPCQLMQHIPTKTPKEQFVKLKEFVTLNNLKGVQTIVVLIGDSYRLLQLEKPTVPDTEIAQASRWLIKDLIDFSLDEAALDVFYAPPRSNQQEKVNIVATRKTVLEDIVRLVHETGLELMQIDIGELAIQQLLLQTKEIKQGVCFLYSTGKAAHIIVSSSDQLYLERKINVDLNSLAHAEPDASVVENLALEVQRSIDFYQSQYGQSTPVKLYLDPLFREAEGFHHLLTENMSIPTEIFDINPILKLAKPFDTALQSYCLPAIGAAFSKTFEELFNAT